jgi:hypothetical protein
MISSKISISRALPKQPTAARSLCQTICAMEFTARISGQADNPTAYGPASFTFAVGLEVARLPMLPPLIPEVRDGGPESYRNCLSSIRGEHYSSALLSVVTMFNGYYNFSSSVHFFQIPDSFGDVA